MCLTNHLFPLKARHEEARTFAAAGCGDPVAASVSWDVPAEPKDEAPAALEDACAKFEPVLFTPG